MAAPNNAKARSVAATKKVVGGMKDLWQLAKKDFTDNSKELKQDFVDLLETSKMMRVAPSSRDAKPAHAFLAQPVNADVGAELLTRYKEEWSCIRRRTEDSSKAGAALETDLARLHGSISQSHSLITACWKEFKHLPEVLAALETTREKVEGLGKLLVDVENSIIECSRAHAELEVARKKDSLKIQFSRQTSQMEKEIQHLKETLNTENKLMDHTKHELKEKKVRERQEAFQEMFQQQMTDYRETGSIERAIGVEERREVGASLLDEVEVEDEEGSASLREFLSDVGEMTEGVEEDEEENGEGEEEENVTKEQEAESTGQS